MGDKKKPAYFRLMKLREEKEAEKRKPTSGLKGTKLDRERNDPSKSLDTESLTASERKAAGRTKQSRRDPAKIEKEKIYEELPRSKTEGQHSSNKVKALKEVRDLVKLKRAQYKKLQELKAILKARKLIKNKLVKRL